MVRNPVTSHGSSKVKSTLTDSRIGRASASISTGHVTVSTSRRLTLSLPQTSSQVLPENTVHIPDMSSVASPWQSVPQSTIVGISQHSFVGGYQGISSSSASQNVGPQTAYLQPQFVAQTGQDLSVWIVGSSLIRNAFVHARNRTGGVHLDLQIMGVRIWWQGYGGMVLKDLKPTIKKLLKYEDPPKYVVIHIAGNDLGKTKVSYLRNEIKNTLKRVQGYLPNTTIIWSQISPRTSWRYSEKSDCMMNCRVRINSAISSFVIRNGGHYIRYQDIVPSNIFLKEDGVHLTDLGNHILLNTLQVH
ncbi:unnamed protein product [Mytilus coruscus]|uniref:SGNH hydrolase-type esterase domain-containing protein n=1 Tax=Mytilus coruscus TaxID=42192 RepID=A0A6J8EPJ9_MYTCO|nr:unnamed protein product [Mytilus coruscus]